MAHVSRLSPGRLDILLVSGSDPIEVVENVGEGNKIRFFSVAALASRHQTAELELVLATLANQRTSAVYDDL